MEIQLDGGVANAGLVVRVGDHVLRPSTPHTKSIHRFLDFVDRDGFDGAPQPVGIDPDGRERLKFIEGVVPLVPYPRWAQTDEALASIARLMRRFHDAAGGFELLASDRWSDEMADPRGGSVVCHNDVCLENVVFRYGKAVALLDFEFAAPGRPVYDVACLARMCVPIDDPSSVRFGWKRADLPQRLRLVADEYGLDHSARQEMVDSLDETIQRGGEFLLRRVRAGDPNFTEMWNANGGMTRFDQRRDWWADNRRLFADAMS